MTLREEILKNSGILAEEENINRKVVKYYRNMFDELYEKALEKSGKEFEEFAGSKEYKEWVDKEIRPLFKVEGVRKIFDKWEQDLIFDYD